MKQFNWLFFIYFMLGGQAVLAADGFPECGNTYRLATNTLSLDCVRARQGFNSPTYYAAILEMLPPRQATFNFQLAHAWPITPPANGNCSAEFDADRVALSLPCLDLQAPEGGGRYRAALQGIPTAGGGTRFLLVDLARESENDQTPPPVEEPPEEMPPAAPKVVLLLHGMNSDETTWHDYVAAEPRFRSLGAYAEERCPVIAAGVIEDDAAPPANIPPVGCYRLRFGRYDGLSGRIGLENIRASGPRNGDFSTFDQLGREVMQAVAAIRHAYRSAYGVSRVEVTLIGHSRGGLAARAFLQRTADSPEKQAVVGLLTTGTPHHGSPLGRAYQYMKDNCLTAGGSRKGDYFLGIALDDCADDWQAVDTIRTGTCNYIITSESRLDMRRPTVADLSDKSAAIADLNANAHRLPDRVIYGALKYTGVELGHLTQMYRLFDLDGPDPCDQVSRSAQRYILAPSGSVRGENEGDGVVPLVSQGFPAGIETRAISASPYREMTFHTDEPTKQAHIAPALREILPDWGF